MAVRQSWIRVRGARQNNLRNLNVDLPTRSLVVVTGVSGSGKSSLVFDTLYAEGQRRYVETFSPYARQFLDRMDRPAVDRIEGVPPAIAIDQTNPVRNSRSTVGTMTEINDHLKLLFARSAVLHCRRCGQRVTRDTARSISDQLAAPVPGSEGTRISVTFPLTVPANFSEAEVLGHLEAQGFTRIRGRTSANDGNTVLHVVRDRFRLPFSDLARLHEAVEDGLARGHGRLDVWRDEDDTPSTQAWKRFSTGLHCPHCDIAYADPSPSLFSFNSPVGACERCRGFGRVIGVDLDLVIPDPAKSLEEGAVKPWQTASFRDCQRELASHARLAGVALDVAWRDLPEEHRRWVVDGDPKWRGNWKTQWYGVKRFFEWLESRAYKMHIRVLLSRYRSYTPCPACRGTRLKPDALLWRLPLKDEATDLPDQALTLPELATMPIDRLYRRFQASYPAAQMPSAGPASAAERAADLVVKEIGTRLRFVCEVGLGYLTLDRQSRTLSGGEVQRINLTTALGTSLVNTLFVLDEPSIGLHPRDMQRVIGVMQGLRERGNSLVVVEHDPQIMLAADHILDMGPGPGERGGDIVFQGSPAQLCSAPTATGLYLGGHRRIEAPIAQAVEADTPRLILEGVRANNLRNIDVTFPLRRLVTVTGVSGSGKSTLIQDVLYPAMCKALGKNVSGLGAAGAHDRCLGADWVGDVDLVDQSPIGKTTRSNPASVVGAFDPIRKLFAATPLARERNYTAGTFSFNTGTGRCPTCGGNGFEHVEMQFLSDVYLRCPDCDGRRFRAEVLEVRLEAAGADASMADVLEMTVSEACRFFAAEKDVLRALSPLIDVGLDYLKLGQAVPTLSGGEAQRLKIAAFLAEANQRSGRVGRGSLLLFDEPTSGLHFEDISRLMRALRKLLCAGHSLIVIEHNLDVVRASDWVIDLGPEGGVQGGSIVAQGTPADLAAHDLSHTGQALRDYAEQLRRVQRDSGLPAVHGLGASEPAIPAFAGDTLTECIEIRNAREHNLRGIDVSIPRDVFTVITGVSGSGKSTLAFDILFNEGQRRYLESLNAYARSVVQPASRPEVDAITGIPPTVSIEQRVSRGGRKSTVATQTELHHFLRLLYVKLGTQHCPDCRLPVEPQSLDSIVARVLHDLRGEEIGVLAPLVVNRKGLYTDLARWAAAKGYGHLRVDGSFLATRPWPRLDRFVEHSIDLPVGTGLVDPGSEDSLRDLLSRALELGKGVVELAWPMSRLRSALALGEPASLERRVFSLKRACTCCGRSFPEPDPRQFSYNSKHGWCTHCFGTGLSLGGFKAEDTGEEEAWSEAATGPAQPCPACHGQRLNPVSLGVLFQGISIADVGAMTVQETLAWAQALVLEGRSLAIAQDLLDEVQSRLRFLCEVGLGYLTLDRSAPTLSGGEAQRIRLAAQLGSNLQGVCYVLDEPTIGLHSRDNDILLGALRSLGRRGNTLVVVEHDEDTIRAADHLIDVGPGAGVRGGRIVAEGSIDALMANPDSTTGRFLRPGAIALEGRLRPVDLSAASLTIHGADLHNLKGMDISIPLGRLVAVTGVSGSGKSSLARDVLLVNLEGVLAHQGKPAFAWQGCRALSGFDALARVLEVDQTPIGKTPRSCVATYVGIWDEVRRLFAESPEAKLRGYGPSRFSFNTAQGRCPACEGQGVQTIEMSFLPDVKLPCDVCRGQRFDSSTREIHWRGKHVGDVLDMSIEDACGFFAQNRAMAHTLNLLRELGLGYLRLGQGSPTLSGGEAQRLKLVSELARARPDGGGRVIRTLYVLDEPSVGLSMADVQLLIAALQRLVDAGHTVVVVEHNLDLIAQCDWVIDLGPEGGGAGGSLVGSATPSALVDLAHTPTAIALARWRKARAI